MVAVICADAPRVNTCAVDTNLVGFAFGAASVQRQAFAIDAYGVVAACRIACCTDLNACRMKTDFAFVGIAFGGAYAVRNAHAVDAVTVTAVGTGYRIGAGIDERPVMSWVDDVVVASGGNRAACHERDDGCVSFILYSFFDHSVLLVMYEKVQCRKITFCFRSDIRR